MTRRAVVIPKPATNGTAAPEPTRRCPRCKQEKTAAEWTGGSIAKGSYCRACMAVRQREYMDRLRAGRAAKGGRGNDLGAVLAVIESLESLDARVFERAVLPLLKLDPEAARHAVAFVARRKGLGQGGGVS